MPFNTLLSIYLLNIFKVKLLSPRYTYYQPDKDQDLIPDKHIVLKMADCLGLTGVIKNKPILNLNTIEVKNGRIFSQQIVIGTSTTGAQMAMRNKEWIPERYQQIVDRFSHKYKFIQLGSQDDPPLSNVLDLRGKTTIRESAAILKNSLLMITHVGFMMHLARAVDCCSVIVYGGREKPEQSGYSCFRNIYSDVECSPCWMHNKCDHDKKCMTLISAGMVENEVLKQLHVHRIPLTVDLLYIR
ncbi:MAG: ADP-heptose:LPS heptosyltransferase-like [Mucilaginibacter sp.]|nr:ADP-heptose:LPS heptosyltransferase-like [Mucilaginibacter sp.]